MRCLTLRPSSVTRGTTHGAALCSPMRALRTNACMQRCFRPITCAAATFAPAEPVQPEAEVEEGAEKPRPFPGPVPVAPAQRFLSAIPLFLFYPALLAIIGAVAYACSIVARGLPVDPGARLAVSYVAAAIGACAAALRALEAKKMRDSAAIIDLYNCISGLDEPHHLTVDMVQAIESKYGINLKRDELEGLRKIYAQMLDNIIPKGETHLRGDEADRLRSFKTALGLSDEDAAPVHLEVGQRLKRDVYRSKNRNRDRQIKFEQLKSFQRLIYVSQVLYGDVQAAMLLPWRTTFNLTDSQLFVARSENADLIFKAHIDAHGGEIVADRDFLRALREKQLAVKMLDDSAVAMVRQFTRTFVETRLSKALTGVRASGVNKDIPGAVTCMREILQYSRQMAMYGTEEDVVPGLKEVSIAGGPWATDAKLRDVKELYRLYLDEELDRLGTFSVELERDAQDLQAVLSLRPADAQSLQDAAAAKVYKKLLKEAVLSKRLEEAESPAMVLMELCEAVRFRPEGALEFHKTQYKTKVASLMQKGRLTAEDVEELKKVRRMLCIPADDATKIMRDTAGKALEAVLREIFEDGPRPLLESDNQRVDQVMEDMKLDNDIAVEVLTKVAKERFQAYVQAAQKAEDRAAVAVPLKQFVQFNALVVTPLLERVKGTMAAHKELAELLRKATEEAGTAPPPTDGAAAASGETSTWDPVGEARKLLQARRGEFGEEEKKGQKEITLRDVVQPEMRGEMYKAYLMQTMTGDVVDLPVGGITRKKGNEAARQTEMARVQALADLLGMNQLEIVQVHQGLGEQAYKQQVTEVLRSGPPGDSTLQYFEEMRQQLGLTKESADKVLKQARTEVYGTNASPEDGSRWTLDKLVAVVKAGTRVDTLMEEPARRNMYRREVERHITDGSGEVDAEYLVKTLPGLLDIKEAKVRMTLKEVAGSRKRRELVQAVSQMRQKHMGGAVMSLQNLLVCSQVLPEDKPLEWKDREELKGVYSLYCAKEREASKQVMLQRVLGLSDHEVEDALGTPTPAGEAAALGAGMVPEQELVF